MHDTGLNDGNAGLDRDIRRALAVDPSAEFVARVRRRIAAEAPPGTVSLPWVCAAVAAIAVAAVAWSVVAPPRMTPARVAPLVARTVPYVDAPADVAASVAARPHLTRAPRVPSRTMSQRRDAVALPAPEILIDSREARAIRAFLDSARERSIEVRPLTDDTIESELKRNIYIAPIIIDPLTMARGPEGVPQ
jgi:hypothetical protein